jgi:hypothetical protein
LQPFHDKTIVLEEAMGLPAETQKHNSEITKKHTFDIETKPGTDSTKPPCK